MSDPNNHAFVPNKHGKCKDIVGTEHCGLPEDAAPHLRAQLEAFTPDDLARGKASPVLGPAYFAADRAAEALCAGFEGGQLKPVVDKVLRTLTDELYNYIEGYIRDDIERNLAGHIRSMVESTVRALLTGEEWALEQYPMSKYHDGEAIRAAIAKHAGESLLIMRIAELETENKRLQESLHYRSIR